MKAKHIGILGLDGVPALHLAGTVDALLAAALDDGYGGRLPCYQVHSIGLTNAPFETESGMMFMPQATLETAPELDTIIVPGGRACNDAGASEPPLHCDEEMRHVRVPRVPECAPLSPSTWRAGSQIGQCLPEFVGDGEDAVGVEFDAAHVLE